MAAESLGDNALQSHAAGLGKDRRTAALMGRVVDGLARPEAHPVRTLSASFPCAGTNSRTTQRRNLQPVLRRTSALL